MRNGGKGWTHDGFALVKEFFCASADTENKMVMMAKTMRGSLLAVTGSPGRRWQFGS